jgi:hypothetical protein
LRTGCFCGCQIELRKHGACSRPDPCFSGEVSESTPKDSARKLRVPDLIHTTYPPPTLR